jgi:mono/diheme cytochrome c family protein
VRARLALIGLAIAACSSALPQPAPEHAGRAAERWPGTTVADLDRGRSLYVASCRGCHALKLPHEIPAEQWAHEVAEMREKQAVKLSDAEADAIVRYLWSLAPDRASQPP